MNYRKVIDQSHNSKSPVRYTCPGLDDYGKGPGYDTALRYFNVDYVHRPGQSGGYGPHHKYCNGPNTKIYPLNQYLRSNVCFKGYTSNY